MKTVSFVENKIYKTKIKHLQLDPFGFCNAKCWFCPVKYIAQPEEGLGVMSIDLIDNIFSQITEEKNRSDGIVDPNFKTITLSHYNEILLYKHFPELLELLRKYNFNCYVLSNGVSLTKQRIDLIKEYKDVVIHVGLNVPAFEKTLWAKRSGFSENQFERLISNLKYAEDQLQYLGSNFQIGMNGLNIDPINSGHITRGSEWETLNYDLHPQFGEHEVQFQLARKLFPRLNFQKTSLYDRAGTIDHMITNKPWLRKQQTGNKQVIGCNNWGDRSSEWLNINSAGSVFLCCNDYNFDYKFGDFNKQTLRQIWLSELHIQTVEKAYKQICTNCYSAKLLF
jgi:radical SAM protein with 4Fe4S-binding SPASM domain